MLVSRSVQAAILSILCIFSAVSDAKETDSKPHPSRLRRADSFLGIHFDFHAGLGDTRIGENVTPEMIHSIIDKVQPDYIQIDCKGHGGFSSYLTKVGNQAGGFVKDPLRIWRDVTAQRGVALYMHYSGVYDVKACEDHPDWAVMNADGTRNKDKTSVFGPYVDELMIPQLKELCQEYGVDGYWIDGDCWGVLPDYNPAVIEQFTQQTGIKNIPKSPNEPYWYEWTQFHRQGFRDYCRHYTDTLHKECPGIQIASNWAFSSMMPEPVTVNVDYLSGDYSLQNSVRDARWQSRCLRNQGLPWDLMAWGFSCDWQKLASRTTKTAEQLKREAAIVLAAGGGFQCFYGQRRDASVRLWQMDIMGEVASFCRARQSYCHRSKSVPQIALFYSSEALYRKAERIYHPAVGDYWLPINGVLNVLLDGQHHVDVVMEHQLKGHCKTYPVIVFPEWEYIDPELHAELISYVKNGGNLLVVGPQSVELFKEELGVKSLDQKQKQIRWLSNGNASAGLNYLMASAKLEPGVQSVGTLVEDDSPESAGWPAGSIKSLGKGQIAAIYTNIGESYWCERTTAVRDYMTAMMNKLLPDPIVKVTGSHQVDVVVNKIDIDGKEHLAINLINMTGPHSNLNVYTFDDITPVGPITVQIRLDKKPGKIMCQPEGKKMKFQYRQGLVTMQVPSIKIHDVYIVD